MITTLERPSAYRQFIERKSQLTDGDGFDPSYLPDFLFPFQRALVDWSLRKGRSAIFADCGLGKTLIYLVWAENVVRHTNRPVLILTPLAVSHQTVREGEKFGIEVHHCRSKLDGKAKIAVTNYERLHYFNSADFSGVVCDESSILKNFDGKTKAAITEFMRKTPYRLLCTATPSPNDYIEIGTSSEALGYLGFQDMLSRFFKQDNKVSMALTDRVMNDGRLAVGGYGKYRFRGHARQHFWRWVCSWARAMRKPSDMGLSDDGFVLPPLKITEHVIKARTPREDWLFDLPAITMAEQRAERRRTIGERCEKVAELIRDEKGPAVAWCYLNEEGHLLEKLIPGAIEVEGNDPDEKKEEAFAAFESGDIRVMVSKPTIAGFGLNWQHCARQTYFPSHSFEQWYQAIRRCWRYGQKREVRVDIIASEGEAGVMANLGRKAQAAQEMFSSLVELMNNEMKVSRREEGTEKTEVPSWL